MSEGRLGVRAGAPLPTLSFEAAAVTTSRTFKAVAAVATTAIASEHRGGHTSVASGYQCPGPPSKFVLQIEEGVAYYGDGILKASEIFKLEYNAIVRYWCNADPDTIFLPSFDHHLRNRT